MKRYLKKCKRNKTEAQFKDFSKYACVSPYNNETYETVYSNVINKIPNDKVLVKGFRYYYEQYIDECKKNHMENHPYVLQLKRQYGID